MKALLVGLVAAVICLAGAVGYLAWDKLEGEDTSEVDEPRYTVDEVISKVLGHEYEEHFGSTTFKRTVGEARNALLAEYHMAASYCAWYEKDGRWVVGIIKGCDEPEFSFHEDTGEVIPLSELGRRLMGLKR